MKIHYFKLLLLFVFGCSSDNFYETERYFETSRNSYALGDDFELTVVIESKKEKSIRFYENYRNLTIWTSLRIPCDDYSKQWCNKDMLTQNIGRGDETGIITFKISQGNPFRKTFKCTIEEKDGRFLLSIPELDYYANYDLAEFDGTTKLGIHGHLDPINPEFGASLEEYIQLKELEIFVESKKQGFLFEFPIVGRSI